MLKKQLSSSSQQSLLGANSALHAADFLGANVEDREVQASVWRSGIKGVNPIVSDAPNGSVAAQTGLQKGDVIIRVGEFLAG
jgi:S1-C subfamily serine protease